MNSQNTRREFIQQSLSLMVGLSSSGLSATSCAGCRQEIKTKNEKAESAAETKEERTMQSTKQRASFEPRYLALHRSGELAERSNALWKRMKACDLCPRSCNTDRLSGDRGFCGANSSLEIASYSPHFGEEDPLVGPGGSGTIFFSHCSLRCVFCINWEISQGDMGRERSVDSLINMMLELQGMGCSNINTVTPTHYLPHILAALDLAAKKGLRIPLVYNTCGWERPDVLRMLDGVVDIYLPDFKYAQSDMAQKYSRGAASYPEVTKAAIKEMHRQVGVAHPASNGLMKKGLMIRHLVMPNNVSGTDEVLRWIASNLPKNTYVNLMSQYRPTFEADKYQAIARRINRGEYSKAVGTASTLGLTNVEIQGYPLSFF